MDDFQREVAEIAPIVRRLDIDYRGLDTRVKGLEGQMEAFRLEAGRMTREIQANTRLTEDVHGNTEEVVSITKWLKQTTKGVLWFFGSAAVIGGALKVFGLL